MPYVEITDFTPGIVGQVSINTPPGAAVPNGTWGCTARNGALVPGPRLNDTVTHTYETLIEESIQHGTAEVQQLQMDAGAGTFTLSWDGQGPTANIDFDATAAAVQLALETLSNVEVGDIVVTGGPGGIAGLTPYVFTWTTLAADEAEHTCDDTGITGAGATVSTLTTGVPPTGFTQAVYDAHTWPDDLDSFEGIYLTGIRAIGPIYDSVDNTTRNLGLNRTEVVVGFEWWIDKGDGTSDQFYSAKRYLRNLNTPVWNSMSPYPKGPFNGAAAGYPTRMTIEYSRNNPTDTDAVGPPVVATLQYRGVPYMWPDPANAGANTSAEILNCGDVDHDDGAGDPGDVNKPPEDMLAHGARMVLFPLIPFDSGSATTFWSNQEGFYYTKKNDFSITGFNTEMKFFAQVFGTSEPSGFATFGSLSNTELLIIKRKGGALLLRGDMQAPTLSQFPNVKSPGFANNRGTRSPLGFAYGVENGGVWVWEGGDTSTPIAQNQLPDFWRPTVSRVYKIGPTTSCSWGEWIIVPNNFYFDTVHQGWWKTFPNNDDATYYGTVEAEGWVPDAWDVVAGHAKSMWHADADHGDRWCYMCPDFIENADEQVIYEFDQRNRAQVFSWVSHPLKMTQVDRNFEARAVALTASGSGTIDVVIKCRDENDDGDVFRSRARFTIDSEFPVTLTESIKVNGTHMQVIITSMGSGFDEDELENYPYDSSDFGTGEAPTIHSVGIDVNESTKVALGTSVSNDEA